MKVILLEKIKHLGELGKQLTVKKGYGRNYLLPQGKAILATPANLKEFEVKRLELEKQAKITFDAAVARASQLEALILVIPARTGDEGRLFGSVGSTEIVKAIKDAGEIVERHMVRLPNGPLRQTGEFEIELQLQTDVLAVVKVSVVAESV